MGYELSSHVSLALIPGEHGEGQSKVNSAAHLTKSQSGVSYSGF